MARCRPYARRTRVRSQEKCFACGLLYERFRSPMVPTFKQAQIDILASARAAVEEGRFEHTAKLPSILGYMHGLKQEAWKEHLHECERYHQEQEDEARIPF